MLDLVFRPLRSALGIAEREMSMPLADTERQILEGVSAIHRATDSIEHHVEVIEVLATSVGPLTESVNQLTATMAELVTLLAPMGAAEQEVQRVSHFLGFRRHKNAGASGAGAPEAPAPEERRTDP